MAKFPKASAPIVIEGAGTKSLAALSSALIFAQSASGVSPLITDDADTVEPQKLQLNFGG